MSKEDVLLFGCYGMRGERKSYYEYLKEKDKEIERLNEEKLYFQKGFIDMHNRIDEAIEYINNHQLVFELSSKKQITDWFDMFYKDLLDILRGEDNE